MGLLSSNNNDPEHWKERYYQTLDDLERRDREWSQVENVLRRSIASLALAGFGVSPALDQQLEGLRGTLRQGATAEQIQELIQGISELASRGREQPTSGPNGAQVLVAVLDAIDLPSRQRPRATKLRKHLTAAVATTELDPLVDEFTALLGQVLSQADGEPKATAPLLNKLFTRRGEDTDKPENPSTEATQIGPLLSRLLENLQLPPEYDRQQRHLRERAARNEDTAEAQGIVDEIAATLAAALGNIQNRDTLPADDEPSPAGHEVLLELLQQMDFPPEMAGDVDALKERLSEPPAVAELSSVLATVAALVTETRRQVEQEKQEIEGFLKQVTERLREFDASLGQVEVARTESMANGHALKEQVGSNVTELRSSVTTAVDLEQLKSVVNERLDAVQSHMETFLKQEEMRSEDAERRIQEMAGRVQSMETETQDLRERMRAARAKALRDSLTGLHNRLALDERMDQEYASWKRYGDDLSLVVLDVDRFKRLNDELGHQAGDKALKTLAGRLRAGVREADFVARYGGEEFVVLMSRTSAEAALAVAEKLRGVISQCRFHYREEPVQVTVSCGVASFHAGDTPESVFQRADQALYRAKGEGRDRCRLEAWG